MGLSLNYSNVANRVVEVQNITNSGPQQFTLQNITYNPGAQQLEVYVNGLRKTLGVDYTETSSTIVTFIIDPLNSVITETVAENNIIVFLSTTVAIFPNFASADMNNLTTIGQRNIENLVASASGGAAIDLSNVNFATVSSATLTALFNAMKNAGLFANFLGN